MRPLATLYSVPLGFFQWSLSSLAIALVLLSLQIQNPLTRVLVSGFCFVGVGVTLLIFALLGRFRGLAVLRGRFRLPRLASFLRWRGLPMPATARVSPRFARVVAIVRWVCRVQTNSRTQASLSETQLQATSSSASSSSPPISPSSASARLLSATASS
jgi:hypothetical protein